MNYLQNSFQKMLYKCYLLNKSVYIKRISFLNIFVFKIIEAFHKSLWGHLYFEVVSSQTGVV